VAAVGTLPNFPVILDGEVVVMTESGHSDFGALESDLDAGRSDRMRYYAFDALHIGSKSLRDCSLADRKAVLAELLLCPGVGARTVHSLALVAEVVHGAPCRFQDPARFSLAHGGKDRNPFPVPLRVYDETIRVMKSAVKKAKLGRQEELAALQRLDGEARRLERATSGPSFAAFVLRERDTSATYGGRSIFGWEPISKKSEIG
jgi:hypothetical protein